MKIFTLFSSYFIRHWHGELSLPISYWINGCILVYVISEALIITVNGMDNGNYSLRTISFASLAVLLFSVTAWFWSIVGIWRSASLHVTRGGRLFWATAAKVMVVAGFILLASQLYTKTLPQIKEYTLIAIGNDPIGKIDIKASANGQSIIIIGTLREGSAAEIQRILEVTQSATLLVLNSNGGRLLEAQQLARIVKNRKLNTYVENQCVSACTYVFLAGKDRAATPNAKIGFHRPTFPGLSTDAKELMTQDMLDVYRSAGLSEPFIQRISNTPHEDMWYPTRDELIVSNVITRMSLGGEATMLGMLMQSKSEFVLMIKSIPIFQAYEKRFPGVINKAADRGWIEKEAGGNDDDIRSATRTAIIETTSNLLKTSDLTILEKFVNLMINQMSAALNISGEACAKLMTGKLDIVSTLPKEIVKQEQQFMLQALASPPRDKLIQLDPIRAEQAIQTAVITLSQRYINVISDIPAHASQPDLVCKATIAFYQSVMSLPSHQRELALQSMFQGNI